MLKKPHILYWKWNDDILDKNVLRTRTLDIIKRSLFDVIYVSLHSSSAKNRIMSNPLMRESIAECAKILKEHDRKMVLDLDIYAEREFMSKNPISEKSYLVKYYSEKLDDQGCCSVKIDGAEGVLFCKSLTFDQNGLFDESSVKDLTAQVEISDEKVMIRAGEEYSGSNVVFYAYKTNKSYDTLGDEYKEKWESVCKAVADTGISGIAADEWGIPIRLECEEERDCSSTTGIAEMASDEMDLDKARFFIEWFTITDGLCRYYKEMFDSDLVEDLLYFRNDSTDREKGIRIVNQYLDVLRKRTADGEQFLYDMSKKYFGDDSIVLCHPTWWGDELDSVFDVPVNGLDWWEVKKDFAQTDELILMPVRMSRSRRCKENLWYNMWYSMRTLDIQTYYKETWINARYGGRTHYLGYECYEPGVVLCLNQKDYLEKCSEMEEKIEVLNQFQTCRPDSRVLIVFGYEAAANWKISDPHEKRWNRISENIHNVWNFAKELFDRHYLCELIPSTEIANGYVNVEGDKISYCGHEYDMLIYILPEGTSESTSRLLQEYSDVSENLMIVGNTVGFMEGCGLLNEADINTDHVISVLKEKKVEGNCGKNYCIYEDGSILFTTDGEKNIGNELKIDQKIGNVSIKFAGEDFLYVKPENDQYVIAHGKCTEIDVHHCAEEGGK